jgi:hypothetical protein
VNLEDIEARVLIGQRDLDLQITHNTLGAFLKQGQTEYICAGLSYCMASHFLPDNLWHTYNVVQKTKFQRMHGLSLAVNL